MNSIQSQILDAVVATLGGEAASVYRCRFTPFSAAELVIGADNVLPDDEQPELGTTDDTDLRHRFFIRHTFQAKDQVDIAVDARYVRAYKLLLADQTLGGLVRWTQYVGRKWEFEKGELDTAALVVTYEVQFSTNRSDPSTPGL
ncbi:MAG TPA: hypothetical protein VFG23_22595 [Polyangia bacterium]|nr:hypothetical protein [Polyangia bacterium]